MQFTQIHNIPVLSPVHDLPSAHLIGFNYAKTAKDRQNKAVHFYLDDYQFERIWSNKERYFDLLRQFKYIVQPDFSLYDEDPLPVQLYNHYRKQFIGAFYQERGLTVIPCLCWNGPESFDMCFEGVPQNSIVSVSSVGTQHNKASKQRFLDGYNEALRRLTPSKILFYGNVPQQCTGNIVHIPPYSQTMKDRIRKEHHNG